MHMALFTAIHRVFVRGDDGQDLVEYGLLASLVAVVCIGAVSSFGQWVSQWWDGLDLF